MDEVFGTHRPRGLYLIADPVDDDLPAQSFRCLADELRHVLP